MGLRRLDITAVRNLQQIQLRDLGNINVFHGQNGSGKTSVLESAWLLGTSRSFRSAQIKSVITHGSDACTIYGEVVKPQGDILSLGVQRNRDGSILIKAAGRAVRSTSELAEHLPLLVINAQSFALLVGTPLDRRQFLDWGVFHVEHQFQRDWQRFQRCIKQRNELLRRDKISAAELQPWSLEMADAGELIDQARTRYFRALQPVFSEFIRRLSPSLAGMELRYRRGWDKDRTLRDALAKSEETDRSQGFTHVGPQRADVRIVIDGHSAGETLSRGQQKLSVCALKLAQGRLLAEQAGRSCTYLVDDLPAELDERHSRHVAEVLNELKAQVFITCVERQEIQSVWPESSRLNMKTFHVEHGNINPDP